MDDVTDATRVDDASATTRCDDAQQPVRASSPILGIVLMVAITVVLSAVVGTFALGLEDSADSSTPDVAFDVDYDDPELEVTHGGGEALAGGDLRLVSETTATAWGDGPVRPGDSQTLDRTAGDFTSGGTVRIVWVGEERSTTLRVYEVP